MIDSLFLYFIFFSLSRKRNDTPLPTPSFRKNKHEEFNDEDQRYWEEEQQVFI